ncbi:unnamed protein product [Cyprideis torosa]|uniref:Methyltransferase type 11 domain-containing protein n=1 Tax=Cyprideis torosa TaxID=163714 RepID=A0A7R8ZI58_9CRUS|nr:unnamed protein product [Cyprideis torosa]CAG0884073.1 unnamed protein product [Cyprideis torosa]
MILLVLLLGLASTVLGIAFWTFWFRVYQLHQRIVAWAVRYLANNSMDCRIGREKAMVFGRIPTEGLPSNGKGLRVLELGPRIGYNLKYYPNRTRLTVVEQNPFYRETFMKALAKEADRGITLERYILVAKDGGLEKIDTASMDVVVSSHALCCVEDPAKTLQEIKRVLVPERGRFFFFEQTEDRPGTFRNFVQNLMTQFKVWEWFTGCHLNRRTNEYLARARFRKLEFEKFYVRLPASYPWEEVLRKLTLSHVRGIAHV